MPMKNWIIRQPDEAAAKLLAKETGLSLLAARVLVGRGLSDKAAVKGFLSPEESLSDPFLIKDMDKAVERIRRAIEKEERIAVYGDYDCDGIMSTVLLYRYLESAGARVCYYIPARDREGYGLNNEALHIIRQDGVSLVITVDNGITAMGEAEYAASIGLDIVITDHHKPRELLPEAAAVVDPHRLDDNSGCEYLAGVGVTFKLICALEGGAGEWLLDQYGDLVAVATVADIVPLTGENRIIVRRGLELLQETANEGLAALIDACGMGGKTLTCENVAFGIVPRINSAGRFDKVDSAVELFVGEGEEMQEIAREINALNDQRRKIEDEIVSQIMGKLENDVTVLQQRVIVISGENWHHGIVGIVASRMVDRFGKPCIVLSVDGEEARGSGRSVEGFSIIDAIHSCADCLLRYGGHNQAAGITLPAGEIDSFTKRINAWAAEHYPRMPRPTVRLDCELSPNQLSLREIEPLSRLEPFGTGNEQPVFAVTRCVLQGIYPIGDGRHLRLRLMRDETVFYAVYFGVTQQTFPYAQGDLVDAAVTVDAGEWNGEMRVSVKIRDLRLSGLDYDAMDRAEQFYQRVLRRETLLPDQKKAVAPTRDDVAVVYRYLRSKNGCRMPDEVLYARLRGKAGNFCKMKVILDVLEEMKLIACENSGGGRNIQVTVNPKKVDIGSSEMMQFLQA